MGKIWEEGKVMRIKIIKFVVKVLGYEWGGDNLRAPIWTIKQKTKNK